MLHRPIQAMPQKKASDLSLAFFREFKQSKDDYRAPEPDDGRLGIDRVDDPDEITSLLGSATVGVNPAADESTIGASKT